MQCTRVLLPARQQAPPEMYYEDGYEMEPSPYDWQSPGYGGFSRSTSLLSLQFVPDGFEDASSLYMQSPDPYGSGFMVRQLSTPLLPPIIEPPPPPGMYEEPPRPQRSPNDLRSSAEEELDPVARSRTPVGLRLQPHGRENSRSPISITQQRSVSSSILYQILFH
jgi:hypothetical protein